MHLIMLICWKPEKHFWRNYVNLILKKLILVFTAGTSSLTCDFENPNLCGYTQDKTDVFDWTRGSGQTSSGSTGPINDHTYSTKTGKYFTFHPVTENPSLCGYTQHKSDVFDWTRGSEQTSSGSTGPINGHTYSTKTGKVG